MPERNIDDLLGIRVAEAKQVRVQAERVSLFAGRPHGCIQFNVRSQHGAFTHLVVVQGRGFEYCASRGGHVAAAAPEVCSIIARVIVQHPRLPNVNTSTGKTLMQQIRAREDERRPRGAG